MVGGEAHWTAHRNCPTDCSWSVVSARRVNGRMDGYLDNVVVVSFGEGSYRPVRTHPITSKIVIDNCLRMGIQLELLTRANCYQQLRRAGQSFVLSAISWTRTALWTCYFSIAAAAAACGGYSRWIRNCLIFTNCCPNVDYCFGQEVNTSSLRFTYKCEITTRVPPWNRGRLLFERPEAREFEVGGAIEREKSSRWLYQFGRLKYFARFKVCPFSEIIKTNTHVSMSRCLSGSLATAAAANPRWEPWYWFDSKCLPIRPELIAQQ